MPSVAYPALMCACGHTTRQHGWSLRLLAYVCRMTGCACLRDTSMDGL